MSLERWYPDMLPLFEQYPKLQDVLPHAPLGEFPTPVQRLPRLGGEIGLNQLFVKRDDLSGRIYGGNKVRKLEFLLGRARRDQAREVLTFGAAGSNHALATALYAKELGLGCLALLMHQPNAKYVRKNLLLHLYADTNLQLCRNAAAVGRRTALQLMWRRLKTGKFPMVIPFGGTTPTAAVGFVNAAFELKRQVDAGDLPEPARVYVALGSMGTAAGLLLGFKAAGLKTKLMAVRVVPDRFANPKLFRQLLQNTNDVLRQADPSFPQVDPETDDYEIVHDFFGPNYAIFTPESVRAVDRAAATEGLSLEGTYTGKTLAALTDHAGRGDLAEQPVLFWNTYNSRQISHLIGGLDYHRLPKGLRLYFEAALQPLDDRPDR